MKKTLEIELEEECLGCPELSLVTVNLYANDEPYIKMHRCEHIEFCKKVRRAWEEVRDRGGK